MSAKLYHRPITYQDKQLVRQAARTFLFLLIFTAATLFVVYFVKSPPRQVLGVSVTAP